MIATNPLEIYDDEGASYGPLYPELDDIVIDHTRIILHLINATLDQQTRGVISRANGSRIFQCAELIQNIDVYLENWPTAAHMFYEYCDDQKMNLRDFPETETLHERDVLNFADAFEHILNELINDSNPKSGQWVEINNETFSEEVRIVTLKLIALEEALQQDNELDADGGPIHPALKAQLIATLEQILASLKAPFVSKKDFDDKLNWVTKILRRGAEKGISDRIAKIADDALSSCLDFKNKILEAPGIEKLF